MDESEILALLSEETIAELRTTQIAAWKSPGQSVGGSNWTITSTAGDGITGPGGTTTRTITGYVAQARNAVVVLTPGLLPVAPRGWTLSLISGAVAVGEVLASAADSTIQFRVTGLDHDGLFDQALVDRV